MKRSFFGKRWKRRIWRSLLVLSFVYTLLFFLFPLPPGPSYSQSIYDRNGDVMKSFLTYDDKWRLYLEPEEISDQLEQAVLFKEDKWFYYHPGINPIALGRALWRNTIKGKRTSGASTISMQVARMLERRPRNLQSKLIEMFRATQLEICYSKKEILRQYLNRIPLGGNVEGIKSASHIYFNKSPDHLGLSEITYLCIVPNRPESMKPGSDPAKILAYRNLWLNRFRKSEKFNEEHILEALNSPLTFYPSEKPQFAPHLAQRLHRTQESAQVYSFIEPETQSTLETLLKAQLASLSSFEIYNGAAIIIHNPSMEVRAYAGSQDFNDRIQQGEVDGVRAVRQPGSTLKPFVFGLAIDLGMITPERTLLDVPINFSGYRPENFDKQFSGLISAKEALAHSLNIPAVNLLNQMGVKQLTNLLIHADCKQIAKDAEKLGLSTALGGCGMRLEELAGLYAALANEGYYHKIRFCQSDRSRDSTALLSPESAFLIHQILKEPLRPDYPSNYQNNQLKIAWKTGTSYGRRDAWCIGYTKTYTVAVWIGNFDGKGVQELQGAYSAAPLVFDLFKALDAGADHSEFTASPKLGVRYVCQESGLPPNPHCKEQLLDDYIPLISDMHRCEMEQEITVSLDSSISYCMQCLPQKDSTIQLVFRAYPPALVAYLDQQLSPYERPPAHNPLCMTISLDQELTISNPTSGLEYLISKAEEDMLQLSAQMPQDASVIYWWVNGAYIGANLRGESRFIQADEGVVHIACTDDKGRSDEIKVQVKYY